MSSTLQTLPILRYVTNLRLTGASPYELSRIWLIWIGVLADECRVPDIMSAVHISHEDSIMSADIGFVVVNAHLAGEGGERLWKAVRVGVT